LIHDSEVIGIMKWRLLFAQKSRQSGWSQRNLWASDKTSHDPSCEMTKAGLVQAWAYATRVGNTWPRPRRQFLEKDLFRNHPLRLISVSIEIEWITTPIVDYTVLNSFFLGISSCFHLSPALKIEFWCPEFAAGKRYSHDGNNVLLSIEHLNVKDRTELTWGLTGVRNLFVSLWVTYSARVRIWSQSSRITTVVRGCQSILSLKDEQTEAFSHSRRSSDAKLIRSLTQGTLWSEWIDLSVERREWIACDPRIPIVFEFLYPLRNSDEKSIDYMQGLHCANLILITKE
jgi:hypothetical protein